MPFSDKELEVMCLILHRLETNSGHLKPIQFHIPEGLDRTDLIFGVCNWKKEYTFIYKNFEKISPYRMKLLLKLSLKVPYKLHIAYLKNGLICVGWKCEVLK